MMIEKKQLKLTAKRVSSLFALLTFFFIIVVFISISLFLYKNFYQAITQTDEIIILREKVALDTVDINKFDLIIDRLTKKTAAKELINIASPFR